MLGGQMRDAASTIERAGSSLAETPSREEPPMPVEAASGRHAREI